MSVPDWQTQNIKLWEDFHLSQKSYDIIRIFLLLLFMVYFKRRKNMMVTKWHKLLTIINKTIIIRIIYSIQTHTVVANIYIYIYDEFRCKSL